MDLVFSLMGQAPIVIEGVTMVVGGFALLATLTKNESDNLFLDKVLRLINVLGANVGGAKNAE